MEECRRYKETPEQAATRTGPTAAMMKLAGITYHRIAAYSEEEGIVKKDLVMANRGDFGTFEAALGTHPPSYPPTRKAWLLPVGMISWAVLAENGQRQ